MSYPCLKLIRKKREYIKDRKNTTKSLYWSMINNPTNPLFWIEDEEEGFGCEFFNRNPKWQGGQKAGLHGGILN